MERPRAHPGRPARLMARIALPVLEQLEAAGADVGAVLAAAGLERVTLDDPDARIEHERWVALLEIGADATRDPAFGLHAAERLSPRSYSLPALLIRSLPTVAEGLARLDRYFRIVHEGMELELLPEDDAARCRLSFAPGLARPRVLSEHMLGIGAVLGTQFLGAHGPRPLEVRFAQLAPASTAEHERVLGAPVVFGAEHDEILFSPSALAVPIESANSHLSAVLEDEARRLALQVPKDASAVGQVVAAVRAELERGREPRLEVLAAQLGVGARTLRRRLEGEGTNLRGLVDDVRKELALEHLAAGSLSLDEIALLLGFSEAAAFRRAFKRWTGRTPSAHRRAHGQG